MGFEFHLVEEIPKCSDRVSLGNALKPSKLSPALNRQTKMEPIAPSGAANSSFPNNPPSRKRFLTNPNPNQASTTASPESSLSSDSSSDRLTKKTRELPNLSDCHSCGHRINYSNPKERLQPLDSMWRIVLLCKKCSKQVKSSDLCPYCFSATAGMDCFKCRDCERCIHKDCVGKYGGLAPWSYCCSGLGFSVCVDCWVPNSLVKSIRVYKRKSRKKNKKVKVVPESLPMPDSRVLCCRTNGTKTLEEVVKDANVLVERKVADAVKAKEVALRKAVAVKSAVELANGATASKEEKGKTVSGEDNMESKVVDDAELAFMLHRAMNSSPRISRSKCSVDSSSLAVPGVQDTRGSASTSTCSKLEVYGNSSNLSEKIDRTVSEASVCFKTSDYCSFIELSTGAVLNAKSSSDGNESQGHGQGRCDVKADRYLLKYRRTDKTVPKPSVFCKSFDCGSHVDLVSLNAGAVTDTRACLNCNEWRGSGDGRCDEKHDRYSLKYTRSCRNGNESPGNGEGIVNERHDRFMLKCTSACVSGNDCEGNCNEHPDRYMLKYTRTRVNENECQGNGEERCNMKPDRYTLKYTRNCVNGSECQGNGEGRCNEKPERYLLKYSRTCLNGNQCLGNVEGGCNEKPDRYLFKYEKRSISSKPVLSCE